MLLIKNNPYRTVGLLVGASAREQERQVKRLKQFLDAEQDPQDDFSFPTLGSIHRTVDSVADAASKLNLNSDKMNAALFWFYKGNQITDEPALDALKEADQENSTDIWTKLIGAGEITQRNSSAFQNLSTLLLCNAISDSSINTGLLQQGISLKLKFLESDFIKDFKALATDDTYKVTKKELQLVFLNELQTELDKNGGISPNLFLQILTKHDFSAKEDFLKSFVQKPIEQIEKLIEESKKKRKENKANSLIIGKVLYDKTSESLAQLKSTLGVSDIKFSSISDKVSDEILQCGIDYFNSQADINNKEGGEKVLELFKLAKSIAIGKIVSQRCEEQAESIKEQIRVGGIIKDLDILKILIDEFEKVSKTVINAKQLLTRVRPYLNNVKSGLGVSDELYLSISSRIASDAQGMLVAEINMLQEKINLTYDNSTKRAAILVLKQKVNEAYEVTTIIGAMDLRQDFRSHFAANRTSLANLKTQLTNVNTGSGGSSGGNCYIATMAYGDYDHPQVIILRKFRDNVLCKSVLGRSFINFYYRFSPKIVEQLQGKDRLNKLIRFCLDQVVKIINY